MRTRRIAHRASSWWCPRRRHCFLYIGFIMPTPTMTHANMLRLASVFTGSTYATLVHGRYVAVAQWIVQFLLTLSKIKGHFTYCNYYYYYVRLTAVYQDVLGKPVPERWTTLDFTAAGDDGVAVPSTGPYANHLHLAPDRQPLRMPFLLPNQQHQSTERKSV